MEEKPEPPQLANVERTHDGLRRNIDTCRMLIQDLQRLLRTAREKLDGEKPE